MADVEWQVAPGLTDYPTAVAMMEDRIAAIRRGDAAELIWLVEHPALYTAGTSAVAADLLDQRLPVFIAGRGGRYTYHGPGQRVIYAMLDLDRRGRDIRRFVAGLEAWIIAALGQLGITAFAVPERVGVWTETMAGPAKIGAIGVRIRRWVTMHGAAVNVMPDLAHFGGIVPCGIADAPVTSIAALGSATTLAALDDALREHLPDFLAGLFPPAAMPLEEAKYLG